jgi:hypothetical protein
MKRRTLPQAVMALGLLAMFVPAPGRAQEPGKLSAEEAQKIGVEAVVYGIPLVVMDLTRRVSTNVPGPQPNAHAPVNQFGNTLEYPGVRSHRRAAEHRHQVVTHGSLKVFGLPLVPRSENLCILAKSPGVYQRFRPTVECSGRTTRRSENAVPWA